MFQRDTNCKHYTQHTFVISDAFDAIESVAVLLRALFTYCRKREREMKVSFVISASLVMLNDRHAWALFSPLSNEMRHSFFQQLVFNLMHISENIITRRALVNSQIALPCHCNCCYWQRTTDSEEEARGRRALFYFMQAKHDVDDGQRFISILWHFHRTLTTSADRNLWNYFWTANWLTKR